MNQPIRPIATGLIAMIMLAYTSVQAQQPQITNFNNVDIKTAVPVLTVETIGPTDISVGKPATFVITVRNAGDTVAEGVSIRTQMPAIVKYQSANVKPEAVENDALWFQLGDLQPNEAKKVSINLIPKSQGAVELSHRTSFSTSTRSVLRVRKAMLTITATGPATAHFGTEIPFSLVITNKGDGPSEQITITPAVADNAPEAAATKPMKIDVLQPGESQKLVQTFLANSKSKFEITFAVADALGATAETKAAVAITRPMLNVDMAGPRIRHIGHSGEFVIRVTNPGDAPAHNVDVVASVSSGLQITAISRGAKFDGGANTLTWQLTSVAPGTETVLSLKATATTVGEHVQQVAATNDAGLAAKAEVATEVIGVPNVWGTIVNNDSAMEMGAPSKFTVLVGNRGAVTATQIIVVVSLPDGVEPGVSDEFRVQQNVLEFEPFTLEKGGQKELHFEAIGRTAGNHRIKVAFQASEMDYSLVVEGNAFVYEDRPTAAVAKRVVQAHPVAAPMPYKTTTPAPIDTPSPAADSILLEVPAPLPE